VVLNQNLAKTASLLSQTNTEGHCRHTNIGFSDQMRAGSGAGCRKNGIGHHLGDRVEEAPEGREQ
jgi:hypothetical protein